MNKNERYDSDKPLVSIITPCYNSSLYIDQAISSVVNQTYQNYEHIIIDDASDDNTIDIIQRLSLGNSKVKLVCNNENIGVANCRNLGMDLASGEYIAFLDSDDIWLPIKLERQVRFMNQHNIGFSYSAYGLIDENENFINKFVSVPDTLSYNELLKNTIIGCLTVMIKKDSLSKHRMDPLKAAEDYTLWLKLARNGIIFRGIDTILAYYRVRTGSVSRNKLKALSEVWNIYRNYENLSYAYSAWCFCNYAYNAITKYKSIQNQND